MADLPELPEGRCANTYAGTVVVFTADQMREYARKSVEAAGAVDADTVRGLPAKWRASAAAFEATSSQLGRVHAGALYACANELEAALRAALGVK